MSNLHPALRAVVTVYIGLQMLVGWVVLWTLQMIVIALMYPFSTLGQRQRVCGHIHRKINITAVVFLNPLWTVKMLRRPSEVDIPLGQPFMFMSNHISNADAWFAVRGQLPYDSRWIAKGALFKIPFGGWGMSNAGELAVKYTKEKGGWGTEKGSVGKLMIAAEETLLSGQPLGIFPEGARNSKPYEGDGMLPFKDGFFTLAIKTGAWIVPQAITGSEKAWPVHDWKCDVCTAYVTTCDPIKPEGHTVESLKEAVRAKLVEAIANHPDRVARRQKNE